MHAWMKWTATAFIGFASMNACAQGALPTEFEVRQAQQRMRDALGANGVSQGSGSQPTVVPRIERLPLPQQKAADIGQVAESFRAMPMTKSSAVVSGPELMVFVSFSMPKGSLERIVAESERTGAVLILRGLKGNSMTRMGDEIAGLIGKRNVTAIVHPSAFVQFKVSQVPSLVLANATQATQIGTDGCASPASFVKVDGDVSQGYALDLIERQAPAWSGPARRFASKLKESGP